MQQSKSFASPYSQQEARFLEDLYAKLGGDGDLVRFVIGLRLLHFAPRRGEDILMPSCLELWVAHGLTYLAKLGPSWSQQEWKALAEAITMARRLGRLDLWVLLDAGRST